MYNNNGYSSYASPPPQMSNNPFLENSSVNRFPDISGQGGSQFGDTWTQQQQQQSYAGQPQQQSYGYNPPIQPQQQYNPTGYQQRQAQPQSPVGQFQPTSSFGQQLSGQINGSGFGQQPQLQQPTGYQPQPQIQQYNPNPYQQAQQQPTGFQNNFNPAVHQPQQFQQGHPGNNPNWIAEFDPYSAISQGWGESLSAQHQPQQVQPQQQMQNQVQPNGQTTQANLIPTETLHPRDFVRRYKAELESWDAYTWKQLQNSFTGLKDAWERRMHEIEGRVKQLSTNWGYSAQGESARAQQMLKDSESHFSSVAASSYQMKEVLDGYRLSTDQASKRRVRDAMNSALQGLPDWPPVNY